MPTKFVSLSSSIILERSKSLECKVRSSTRVQFEIEAYNFAWEEDLKNMDNDSLTSEDVRTCCFSIAVFIGVAFFNLEESRVDFLLESGCGGRDSKEDEGSFLFGLNQSRSKFVSINLRGCFD